MQYLKKITKKKNFFAFFFYFVVTVVVTVLYQIYMSWTDTQKPKHMSFCMFCSVWNVYLHSTLWSKYFDCICTICADKKVRCKRKNCTALSFGVIAFAACHTQTYLGHTYWHRQRFVFLAKMNKFCVKCQFSEGHEITNVASAVC